MAGIIFKTYEQFETQPNILDDVVNHDVELYKKSREMRAEPTIALARAIMAGLIIKNPWRIESKDERAKEILEQVLLPHRTKIMRDAVFSAIDYGWQTWEVRPYLAEGGVQHIRFKALRHEYSNIYVNRAGLVQGVKNQTPEQHTAVRIDKQYMALSNINSEYDNPYGQALILNAENTYDASLSVEKAAGKYITRTAGAHWILFFPTAESEINGEVLDNSVIADKILSNIGTSSKIALPVNPTEISGMLTGVNAGAEPKKSGWDIKLLTADAKSMDPFLDRQKYLDALKMRALFIPERVALEGQFGTKAESSEHADIALICIEQVGADIIESLNGPYGFVHRVLEFNGFRPYPGFAQIVPLPLADEDKSYMREVFRTITNNAENVLRIIDIKQLAGRANIPIDENAEIVWKDESSKDESSKDNNKPEKKKEGEGEEK